MSILPLWPVSGYRCDVTEHRSWQETCAILLSCPGRLSTALQPGFLAGINCPPQTGSKTDYGENSCKPQHLVRDSSSIDTQASHSARSTLPGVSSSPSTSGPSPHRLHCLKCLTSQSAICSTHCLSLMTLSHSVHCADGMLPSVLTLSLTFLKIYFYIFPLVSGVQPNIMVRHLHPSQHDNPPKSTIPLTLYVAVITPSLIKPLPLYLPPKGILPII